MRVKIQNPNSQNYSKVLCSIGCQLLQDLADANNGRISCLSVYATFRDKDTGEGFQVLFGDTDKEVEYIIAEEDYKPTKNDKFITNYTVNGKDEVFKLYERPKNKSYNRWYFGD